MKIFFTNSMLQGCYFVRAMVPLREGGWDGDRTSWHSEVMLPEEKAQAVLNADVIVFHRPNDDRSLAIATKLREQGKKIVMDNDDTYKNLGGLALGKFFEKIDTAVDNFARYADLVTCSTEYLAQEYRKLNPNVVVLPNCVDPDDWPEEPQRNGGEKVRIGIVGSVGLNSDVTHVRPVIKKLAERDDVQLVLFALPKRDASTMEHVQKLYEKEYAYWDSLNIEWQPFVSMKDYIETLDNLQLDILMIPRSDDYFNRCKSNLKFLEASMLEIPVVAQGWEDHQSPYQVDPEDEAHMSVVVDNSKWEDTLERLIQDKEWRRQVGEKARKYVTNKYAISKNIHLWTETYRKLLS
jgi:glycosyltransferase involved in cell wall biosynthesis